MSYSVLVRTIQKEFTDNFVLSGVEIFPPDAKKETKGVKEWIRPDVVEIKTTQPCRGTSGEVHKRSRGFAVIQCFNKLGQRLRSLEIVEAVTDLLELKTLATSEGKISFQMAQVTEVGTEINGYWQTNVRIPYKYDAI